MVRLLLDSAARSNLRLARPLALLSTQMYRRFEAVKNQQSKMRQSFLTDGHANHFFARVLGAFSYLYETRETRHNGQGSVAIPKHFYAPHRKVGSKVGASALHDLDPFVTCKWLRGNGEWVKTIAGAAGNASASAPSAKGKGTECFLFVAGFRQGVLTHGTPQRLPSSCQCPCPKSCADHLGCAFKVSIPCITIIFILHSIVFLLG